MWMKRCCCLTDCDAHEWARIKDWSDSEVDIPDGNMQVVEHPSYNAQRDNTSSISRNASRNCGQKNRSHCRSWSGKVNLEIGFAADGLCASRCS